MSLNEGVLLSGGIKFLNLLIILCESSESGIVPPGRGLCSGVRIVIAGQTWPKSKISPKNVLVFDLDR